LELFSRAPYARKRPAKFTGSSMKADDEGDGVLRDRYLKFRVSQINQR
jgi:hypothetical protein